MSLKLMKQMKLFCTSFSKTFFTMLKRLLRTEVLVVTFPPRVNQSAELSAKFVVVTNLIVASTTLVATELQRS